MKIRIHPHNPHTYYLILVIVVTLLIGVALSIATCYINYWPTDSENPYIPAAAQFFKLPYPSAMHFLSETQMLKITMRFKETLIVALAYMQRLLNDTQSLYPNVLLLIIATAISAMATYLMMKRIFNAHIGFFAFLLFSTSFWPYLYILQGAHPPLVLANFLLSALLLSYVKGFNILYFLSGIFLGLMLFSSPTSPVYLPYYLGAFVYFEYTQKTGKLNLKDILRHGMWIFWGAFTMFAYFTFPDPLFNIKQAMRFLAFSQHGNNFVIYRDFLSQYFTVPDSLRGGGWIWIFKYFFLIMPLMFSAYLLCMAYLLVRAFKKPALFLIIVMSLSTPILVETIKVAQFGRNYFSWLPGIILLISFTLHDIWRRIESASRPNIKRALLIGTALFISGHICFNTYVFLNDVFPSRMATTYIYNWLIRHHTNELYVYENHPRYKNMIEFLNNQKVKNKIYFWPIKTIADAKNGFILIPTITGKTIWCECREGDFEGDPYLTDLFRSGEFSKYVVATFKTLSSSKMWAQEEEICTYRDLMVKDILESDRQKGMAWLLDAEKLRREWFSKK